MRGQEILDAFVKDKEIFIKDFPELSDLFASEMQNTIDKIALIPRDKIFQEKEKIISGCLNYLLVQGETALDQLYDKVDLLTDSKDRFGRNLYNKNDKTLTEMAKVLNLANHLAESYINKADLFSVEYTQASIDELKQIADNISVINKGYEDMIAAHEEEGKANILYIDNLKNFMQQINIASKVVFIDNPTKLKLYSLNDITL